MIYKSKEFNELTLNELYGILRARYQVFTLEQQIYYQDMDGIDFDSRHFFIEDNGEIVAYLRAFYTSDRRVKIGRVLTTRRKIGLGMKLMERALEDIRNSMICDTVCLDSQTHAVGFYERFGFMIEGDEFIEAGIPHVSMILVTE